MEPLQPTPLMKPRKKHGCLISFVIVIVSISIIGGIASTYISSNQKTWSAQSSASSTASSGIKSTPAKIGTAISNDKVSIKVNSVKETSKMYDDTGYLTYTPDAGGKFVVINITAKNVGNELYSFMVNNFQIESSDGKQYSPSTMFTAGNSYLNSGSMNPGLSETGNIAFEVPKETKLSTLTLEFQEFLSLNTADFSLSKK